MNKQTKISIISVFITLATVYALCQVFFLYGALKERNSKVCVDPYSLKLYEENSNSSLSIVGLAFEQKREQLAECQSECQKEIKKWKDNYLWLKSKPVATSTITNL